MSFLAPLWLALAAAAAVPLLLHLMRRRSGNRVEFPAVRYLQRAEREHSAKLRLRNLLLMLLRVLALLLIALAAARPITRLSAGGHPPTAVAIVLDNSLSTGAAVDERTVLAALRTQAEAVLASAATDDRLWLVTVDGEVRAGSASDLTDALAEVRPFDGAGSIATAIARAEGLVANAGIPARHIVVLTDGQASAWAASVALRATPVSVYVPAIEPPANRSVADATPRPARWTPRGAITARVATSDSVTWRVALGERTLARGIAGSGEELVVRGAPDERGWVAGTVELEPDELRADDVRHFALWIGPPVGVAVSAAAGPFAAIAVDALVQQDRAVPGADVIVTAADGDARLPAVLLAPNTPARVGAANRTLERLGIPWRFGPARTGRVALRGAGVEGAAVMLRYPLIPQPGAESDTLLVAGTEAWAVAGPRYVLLGSPLIAEATDFPIRAAFVPWLGETIAQRLGSAAGPVLAAAPGEPVMLPRDVDGMESPGGEARAVSGTIAAPARAGVYFLTRGAERAGALVVNPEPSESVLRRLDSEALRARIRAADLAITGDPATVVARAWAADGGRSAAGPLILVALGLLVVEAAVARRGKSGEASA